ncbi:hypothetical protein PF010_g8085 [Phytophthora fragariae]|uniref:Helicase ATP-binding domain-containing protein n=1 Tax=Phytophthora fragariae TaxID=53985 RepID=A0A6G0LFH8_9STRA|nr:hypothetical protein PF010_g8085 [Phytophthora fragariae]
MPRRKSTPSKRPLDAPPSQPSASKRSKRCKQPRPPSLHQHREPLPLSRATTGDAEDALRLQLPVHSRLLPSLAAVCNDEHALQLQIDLTLSETAQLQLHLHGQSPSAAHAPVALAELFPHTCEAFRPHVATLAERGLLSLHINAHRTSECDDWSFTLAVRVAWREYMTLCSSRGLLPGSAAPRATPMRAMHHVMIWLLKQTHDAERGLSEVEKSCSFRYWSEIELLCARCVGDSSAMCEQFQGRTFAMPEIYARIDAARQLRRDISEYEAAEAASTDLLPTLRPYQKAAVAWMLSREKTTSQQGCTLLLGVTFKEETARDVQAYDPFCAVFHTVGRPQVHQEQLRPIGMDLASVRGGILADEMGLGKTVEVIALVLSRRKPLSRPQLLSMHSCVETDEDTDVTDDTVACICGSSENHPMGFVQCEFCGTWHHQLCTGYMVHASGEGSESSSATSLDGIWDFESSDSAESGATSTWSSGGFMCYHCQSQERPSFATRTTLIVSPEPIHAQWEHEFSRHVREGALSVMRYPGVRALRTRLEGTGPSAEWQVLASPGLVLARYDVVLTTYEALGADLRHVPTTEGEDRRSSTRSQRKRYAFVGSPLVALRFWRVCMDEAQVGVENTRLQAALTLARLSADNRWVVTGTPFSSRVSELFGYLRFLRISPYASMQVETSQNLQLLQAENDEQEGADLCFFRESIERNFAEGAIDRVLDLLLWSGQDSQPAACGGGILWRTGKKHVLDQLNLPPQNSEVVWCQFAAVERHFYDQQEKRIISLVQQRQRRQSEQTSDVIAREDRLWQDLLILRQLCCHPQVGGARQAWGSGGNSTGGAVMTMDAFLQELLNKATRECEDAQRQLIGAQNGLAGLLVLDDDISGAALKYMAQMSLIRKNWSHFRADLLPRLHILQNLQKCVQQLYTLPDGDVGAESTDVNANPKRECLLPELPALEERISSTGLLPGSADLRNEDLLAIKPLSDGPPSDADIELSGNCAKCRDGGTGPMCVHCQLYKELGAYRQHFLGIDKTSPGKTHIMHLLNGDDGSMEGDDNTAATRSSGGGSSVSLFVEVFKEISGCARNALRSQPAGKGRANNIQTEMQSETEFWTKLQREWLAAKKLFQAQHQRLGALDELVMACSQLRLRQPGEPAARTKAERLYKLERVEVPVREAELEAERTAADLDLRSKMAQLRYFLQLQAEESTADSTSTLSERQNETVSGIPHQPTPPGGSLGSKLDALLARVDMLRQENPGVKCLLFSQWSRMLELTVRSLPRLGVRCFMYDTKRQLPKLLTQFQACPAACVLALPFKVGANGLNIVEATEVLLIEPLLSTSIEAQAVNRVHRLGQTRRTRVHRFIVRGSVEERIYRLGHKQKTGNSGAELSVGEEKEEDDDGLQRLGVAPGRKEQEKLTMQDLQNLLHGNSNSGEQHAQAVAAFWDESVVLNGKTVSRRAACAFLERRHATRVREENQTQFTEDQEPHTTLFDKAIALLVAEELLTLSYPLNENDVEVVERVDPQILQHHHDRINEEMRVWKAAHGDM